MDQIDQNNVKPNVWWQLKCDFTVVTTSPLLPFHRDHRSECGIKSDFWWRQETGDFQYGFIPVWIGSKIFRPKWSVYAKFFGEKVVLGSSIVETVGSPSGREWTTMAQETWSRERRRGGQVDKERSKVIKSYQRETEANDNDKWTTMAQDCWPDGLLSRPQLRVEKDLQFWTEAVFWEEIWFSSDLFFKKYVHKYHKQEMNSRSNLSA